MIEPRASTDPITLEFSPFTTALMAITVLTPITIPKIVRKDRSGFLLSASSARPTASRNSLPPPAVPNLVTVLLRSQCHYGIEARRLGSGVYAKEESNACGHH